MKKLAWIYAIPLLFALSTYPAIAQESVTGNELVDQLNLEDEMPVDPKIRLGTLENGLTYYIRQNDKPANKVELRLAVKAGSILESSEQLGLAHFMEHMAFNGTKNFEKNELVSYLQSVGVKFGMHLNAYTSFDETVYMLPIPSDSAEVLEKGFQILQDWAANVSLKEEDIDAERGIVVEEWRTGQGPEERMREEYFPVLFKNSRYAERLPIGEKQILENFEYETLRRFYRDWYRPNLMAVVIVGDIDVDQMEKNVKEYFSGLTNPKNAPERKMYDIPSHEETFVSIVTDKEASFNRIQVYYKTDPEEEGRLKDYKRGLTHSLFSGMINRRLAELQQQADPPFLYGASYYSSLIPNVKDAYQLMAVTKENEIERGLKAVMTENARVSRHGFTQSELDRYKSEMLSNYERAYNERTKNESKSYANEYIRNFLQQESIPGIEFEYFFTKKYLPEISLEDVNKLADQWITDDNRVVVVTGPEKEGNTMPEEEAVLKILNEVKQMQVEPYVDELTATNLMESTPEPGTVASTKTLPELDVTELTLSNGLKVVLKPTEFKNDQILLSAYSPGGTSLYPLEDHFSAEFASNIIRESGVKDFSTTDLQKLLSGKTVNLSPYIGTLKEGFSGGTTPKDLETMFQLVNLYFTEPRKDEESFASFINKNKGIYQNLLSNPRYYYSDTLSKIMTSNHPRGGGYPTAEDFDEIDFNRVFEIYNDRFKDASDFTFFLVGNFDIDEITPLLETYLGSLEDIDRQESWEDLGIRPPEGLVDAKVVKGTEPQSTVTIKFSEKKPYDRLKAYYWSSFAEVVNLKLIEQLREEKGGVYSAGSRASASLFPYEHYEFNVGFPCAPENVDDLTQTVFSIIEEIQENGISDEDMQKIKETQRRIRDENMEKNSYWLNALESYYYRGIEPEEFLDFEERVKSLSAKDIQAVSNELIDMDEYIRVVLYPENYSLN